MEDVNSLTRLPTGRDGDAAGRGAGGGGWQQVQVVKVKEEEEGCPVSGGEEKERSLLVSGRFGSVTYVSRRKTLTSSCCGGGVGGGGEERL